MLPPRAPISAAPARQRKSRRLVLGLVTERGWSDLSGDTTCAPRSLSSTSRAKLRWGNRTRRTICPRKNRPRMPLHLAHRPAIKRYSPAESSRRCADPTRASCPRPAGRLFRPWCGCENLRQARYFGAITPAWNVNDVAVMRSVYAADWFRLQEKEHCGTVSTGALDSHSCGRNLPMTTLHQLVSVYVNEADQWEHRPLHLEILNFLHKSGCAGGTVLRGVAGFTAGAPALTLPSAGSEGKLPVVVQFIDVPEKVAEILPALQAMVGGRLMTVQPIQVLAPDR